MKRQTQKARVLALLSRGWVHFRRLNEVCFRYGGRIHELRRAGYVIERKRGKDGAMYYRRPV